MNTGVRESSRHAAKELILDIIAAAHGELRGATRLNKAFYFAHLFYWQKGDGVLTDYPIVRMPNGPGIDEYQTLIAQLAHDGLIEVISKQAGPYPDNTYSLKVSRDVDTASVRGQAIHDAVKLVERKTAAELSEMIHERSRAWQDTPNGRELNIYGDLVEDRELDRIRGEVAAFREAARSGRRTP